MTNDTILKTQSKDLFEELSRTNASLDVFKSPIHAHIYFRSLAPVEREIFNKVVRYANKYKIIYPRQTTIARQVGCSREHVNRTISKFERDGLLEKNKIGYGACVYRFSSFVYKANFRIVLSPLLTAFLGIFLLSPKRIEAQKFTARALFLEEVTITYKYSSLKQEGYSLSRRIAPTDFYFWKDKDLGEDNTKGIVEDSRCSPQRLCMICEHEQEIKKEIVLFKEEIPLNDGRPPMSDAKIEAKKISLTEYFPHEPYQNLQEEIEWLTSRALSEAKMVACNAYCRENLNTCANARNNYYRLAWDDLQKEKLSKDGYTRRSWQQWAMATFQKPYICTQKNKYFEAQKSKDSDVKVG
jgi:hypothetical protein